MGHGGHGAREWVMLGVLLPFEEANCDSLDRMPVTHTATRHVPMRCSIVSNRANGVFQSLEKGHNGRYVKPREAKWMDVVYTQLFGFL